MGKIYRNIYFYGSSMKSGRGNIDIQYYGHIFNNAKFIKDFDKRFDQNLDLQIICGTCAANKYRNFIKVTKS